MVPRILGNQELGYNSLDLEIRNQELGYNSLDLEIRIQELGYNSVDLGIRNQELGYKNLDLGIRNQELGIWIRTPIEIVIKKLIFLKGPSIYTLHARFITVTRNSLKGTGSLLYRPVLPSTVCMCTVQLALAG